MFTHPHLAGREADRRHRELLAEAARGRLLAQAAGSADRVAAVAPLLADRRLHALAALLALLAGLLFGGGEADAAVRYNPRGWSR